ncbi:MAG: carboxymuconolactone decarboxylase family protein [Microthrixaceae bacterium]
MSKDHQAAVVALAALESVAWRSDDPDRLELLARVCAGLHGLAPLARPAELGDAAWTTEEALAWRDRDDLDERTIGSLAFAERFSLDVGAITDEDRAAFAGAAGPAMGDIVFQLYVLDMGARVAAAAHALLDDGRLDRPVGVAEPAVELWPAIDRFLTVVALEDALDVVMAEVVRLRGARQHRCRKCQSLRSRSALVAGADEATFDAIDHDPDGLLDPRQRAALAVVDTMIWSPARWSTDVVAAARDHLTEAERAEVVLDVMRNGANKIAVALAADAADVEDGFEVYDLGEDGVPVYGLTAP